MGVVDARAEAGRHQGRGVVLVDDGGAGEAHARRQPLARIAGRVGEAGPRKYTGRRPRSAPRGVGPVAVAAGVARRGSTPIAVTRRFTSSTGRRRQIVGVEPAMLGVERRQQLVAGARAVTGPSPTGHVSSKLWCS